MKFGFIVLCPTRNVGQLKTSCSSIRMKYPECSILAVVDKACEIPDFSKVCPTCVGENTITSLINSGMHHTTEDWNLIIFAGSWVPTGLVRKFDLFVKEEKDILYPVVDRKMNFVYGSMNGILIHKNTFSSVGNFITNETWAPDENKIDDMKSFWMMKAMLKGCTFKGIVGLKII